jgi:hypothetical protein
MTGWVEGYRCQETPQACQGGYQDKGKFAKSPDKMLKWIKDLNPRLHTECCRVMDGFPEPKGQKLILLIERDSHNVMQDTRYKIFKRHSGDC